MGIETTLIVIIIAVVLLMYFGGSFLKTIGDFTELSKGYVDAAQIQIKPQKGDTVCDLKLQVFGYLNEKYAFSPLYVQLGEGTKHPEAVQYDWINCRTYGTLSIIPFSIFGMVDGDKIREFAISVIEEKFHIEVVLVASDGKKIDAHTQPTLYKYITLPAGVFPLPLEITKSFVISDIPRDKYTLQIYYGREINNLGAGTPYLKTINP